MDKSEWRIVTPLHVAPTRKEALADVQEGGTEFLRKYWVDALGNRHNVPEPDNEATLIEQLSDTGQWIVGSPDDCIAAIERLQEATGGFGGLLFRANEYANPEATRRSYEMFARYVMPKFQGSLGSLDQSYNAVVANVAETKAQGQAAIERAHNRFERGAAR